MKIKMKNAFYDEITGLSIVTIQTELGEFSAKAKLNKEEDKDIASRFHGCKIAEARAILKYLKQRRKNLKTKLNTLRTLNSNLIQLKNYNNDSIEARYIRKQCYIELKNLKHMDMTIENIEKLINNLIVNFRNEKSDFINKINKMKEQHE